MLVDTFLQGGQCLLTPCLTKIVDVQPGAQHTALSAVCRHHMPPGDHLRRRLSYAGVLHLSHLHRLKKRIGHDLFQALQNGTFAAAQLFIGDMKDRSHLHISSYGSLHVKRLSSLNKKIICGILLFLPPLPLHPHPARIF